MAKVIALLLIAIGLSAVGGCRSGTRGTVRVVESVNVEKRPPREFKVLFTGSSGEYIPAGTGVITARVRGEEIPLEEGWKGYAEYDDSIEISVVMGSTEFFATMILPVSDRGDTASTVYSYSLKKPGREFYHGPNDKVEYISYATYIHVIPSDKATPEAVRKLFTSLGLRRLRGSEMGQLGIYEIEVIDEYTNRSRMRPLRDGDPGPIIVVKARGGEFDRFNSPELRALRSSNLIGQAGPYVGFWEGSEKSYSNCLKIMCYAKEYERVRTVLLANGFNIDAVRPHHESGIVSSYTLTVHTDNGVGRGLWEIIDWLHNYLGIGAMLCEPEWQQLNNAIRRG